MSGEETGALMMDGALVGFAAFHGPGRNRLRQLTHSPFAPRAAAVVAIPFDPKAVAFKGLAEDLRPGRRAERTRHG